MNQIVTDKINSCLEMLFPHDAGEHYSIIKKCLNDVAAVAYREGENSTLMFLLSSKDVAERLGITDRRVRAIAQKINERFSVGWKVPGTETWLFKESEIELLRPGKTGRPSNQKNIPKPE
jgi:hypothetical protein